MQDKRLKDRYWRLNNLYYIVNEKGKKVKFKLNPVQEAIYHTLWFLSIILKSRQHGVTTLFCILYLDACLFKSNVSAGIIAHNREDAEKFFKHKVKFAYDNLPEWLKAERVAQTDTVRELHFSNNSSIRVGTSMRSGTLQYLHISEHGKICKKYPEKAEEIKTGSLNTVHVGSMVTIESTAEGRGGDFHDICTMAQKAQKMGEKLTEMDFKFMFFPWYKDMRNQLHADGLEYPQPLVDYFEELDKRHSIQLTTPQKNWYFKKWAVQATKMKQEHPSTPEEAFEVTVEGAYYKSQFDKIYAEGRITSVPYQESALVHTAWDIGRSDHTAIWFFQLAGLEIHLIDYFQDSGEGMPYYAEIVRNKPYDYGEHYAPHDIEVTEWGAGINRVEQAKRKGINFITIPRTSEEDGVASVRETLARCWFDKQRTDTGVKCLENFTKEWNVKLACWNERYLHNWASHGSKAFQYLTQAVSIHSSAGVMGYSHSQQQYHQARQEMIERRDVPGI